MTDWATIHAVRGDDGVRRCGWSMSAPEYIAYHDNEWGRPVVESGIARALTELSRAWDSSAEVSA